MTKTINITSKDGQVWNIHRSVLDSLAKKSDEELEVFFKTFWTWFDQWEQDVLLSLVKMEREGIAIDHDMTLKYNR